MTLPTPDCPVCGGTDTSPRPVAWDVPIRACARCRSAFVWPRPEAHELRLRYEDEHRDGKWAEYFDQEPPDVWSERIALLDRLTPERGRVLDVGCGAGQFLRAAAGHGWSTVGTELALPPLLDARRGRARSLLAVAEMSALRAAPDYDAVTFWDVLEHVPDPLTLLIEARRRLRPRGIVAATMPNAHGTTAWLHGGHWKYYDVAEYGHLFHLSLRGLSTLFRRAGLEVALARTIGSTDLRYVPEVRGHGAPAAPTRWVLDRLSGLLALVAPRIGYGNTLVVAGRLP